MAKRSRKSSRSRKVPIAHTYYKLDPHYRFPDSRQCGETEWDGGKKTIRVSERLQEPLNWSLTFWHEWFHAVRYELGLSEDEEESHVEALASAVMIMLTDPHGRSLLQEMLDNIPCRKA